MTITRISGKFIVNVNPNGTARISWEAGYPSTVDVMFPTIYASAAAAFDALHNI